MAITATELRHIQAEALKKRAERDPEIINRIARVTAAMAAEMKVRPNLTVFTYDLCQHANANELADEFLFHGYSVEKVMGTCNCPKSGACETHEGVTCDHTTACPALICLKLVIKW